LSGGGAYGIAHIGVIKALEENNIPIDYITGTSAGAFVGSMYAAGFSAEEMTYIVSSESFILMSEGKIEAKLQYYFSKQNDDASWVDVNLSKDFDISKSLPTNRINSSMLDYGFFQSYSLVSAKANYNFDSLFVPFRCVSADIVMKQPHIYRKGHLNKAVRASMTYPGYLLPIEVDGHLMFDGGLYNNFPSEVMYEEFLPDVIIGVNFSDSIKPPEYDDVISQLKSMIINRDDLTIPCKEGVIIKPKLNLGLFDFNSSSIAIEEGYNSTMLLMDSIKNMISRRVDVEDLKIRRDNYKGELEEIEVDKLIVLGIDSKKSRFIEKSIIKKGEKISEDKLKQRYFKLLQDRRISSLYPLLTINDSLNTSTLELQVRLEKPFTAKFGGLFSSMPINTGFLSFDYSIIDDVALNFEANTYFGKFYSSVYGASSIDTYFPIKLRVKLFASLNSWDYFKSFSSFFDDIKPSFIVEDESFYGVSLELPIYNRGKIGFKSKLGNYNMQYYQTEDFLSSDTADASNLFATVSSVYYKESSLNRKQFADKGMQFSLQGDFVRAIENTVPGSTSPLVSPVFDKEISWYAIHGKFEKYLSLHQYYSLGFEFETHWIWASDFLDNYTASIISAPSYSPFLEFQVTYNPKQSGHDILGFGVKNIFHLNDNVHFRLESYITQHYTQIKASNYNLPYYDLSNPFKERYYTSVASLVYHSPVGPISVSGIHSSIREMPFSFMVNFGYLIFNERLFK